MQGRMVHDTQMGETRTVGKNKPKRIREKTEKKRKEKVK
jgi:hypothetical protein